jgi:hypothetical protein
MKQVVISYSHQDAAVAERLAKSLRKRHVASFVRRDAPVSTMKEKELEKAASQADGFVFVLGAGSSSDEDQRREWQHLLRADFDGQKTMIPVLLPHGKPPPFLGYRVPIRMSSRATDCDEVAKRVLHYLKHPDETRDEIKYQEGLREYERRMEGIKEWAQSLREAAKHSERSLDSDRR